MKKYYIKYLGLDGKHLVLPQEANSAKEALDIALKSGLSNPVVYDSEYIDKQNEMLNQQNLSMLDWTNQFAKLALYSTFIINGTGIGSILALVGNLQENPVVSENITKTLSFFLWGLSLTVFASILAYVIQLIHREKAFSWALEEITCEKRMWRISANILRVFAILLVFISLALFIYGSLEALYALKG